MQHTPKSFRAKLNDAICCAIEGGYEDLICVMLKKGLIDVYHEVWKEDDDDETLFAYAAKYGRKDILNCILEHDNYKKEDAFSCMEFSVPFKPCYPSREFLKWDPEILAIRLLEPGSILSIERELWDSDDTEDIEVELKEGSMQEVYDQITKIYSEGLETYEERDFTGIIFEEDGKYIARLET